MSRFRRASMLSGIAVIVVLGGCETVQLGDALGLLQPGQELSLGTIASGLKEALKKGTDNAAAQLSAPGGYANDTLLHIPVPEELANVAGAMRRLGLGNMVDNFEAKMNSGAEQAAAKAKPIFWNAITQMSFADAKGILSGGETAATDYFRATIGEELRSVYTPIVAKQLNSVGAVRAYNDLVTRYAAIPFVKKPALNLEDYATQKALDGLFMVISQEEKKIRQDPAARTTELLRRVFGSQG